MTANAPAIASVADDRVLAVRLPNWVGDVCMALPALAYLRARGWRLHLFGRRWAVDLLAAYPDRRETLPGGWRAASAALRASGASQGLLFTNSFSSALQMRWAGIRAVGYAQELRSFLLAVAPRRRQRAHEVEAFWELALTATNDDRGRALQPGEPPASAPPTMLGLELHPDHRRVAAAALAAAGVAGAYTVLCPFAAGRADGRSKEWPSFPLLSRGLVESRQTVVVCPGPGEEPAADRAAPGCRSLPGLGLGAYAAVLAGAQAVVANDSGPMHLAAAVGAPVIGIFGVSDPARTRPWHPAAVSVGAGAGWPTLAAVGQALAGLRRPGDTLPTVTRSERGR